MQADRQPMQSTHHMRCPLCHAPLDYRTGNGAIGITDRTDTHIFCAACGFSAPFVSRQHAQPSQQSQSAQYTAQTRRPTPVRQQSPVSVWVDSTISAYPQEKQPFPTMQGSDEPATPVPPRASAPRARAVKVRPRYPYTRIQPLEDDDLSRLPTMPPPTTWEYESHEYTAESSLSSLSLIVDTPTRPHIEGPDAANKQDAPTVQPIPYVPETPPHGMPRIEEMDTRPLARSTTLYEPPLRTQAIDEIATHPQQPGLVDSAKRNDAELPSAASLFLSSTGIAEMPAESLATPTRSLIPAPSAFATGIIASQYSQPTVAEPTEPTPWTAGAAAGSSYAQRLVARDNERRHLASFNVFDRLRWWLLHPGRFELLLWLSGTLLLVIVTCIFVLVTVFSLQSGASRSSITQTQASSGSYRTGDSSTTLVLSTATSTVQQGQPLRLYGQGFSANAHIALSYDTNLLFLDKHGQPVIARADGHGTFAVTLSSPPWGTGKHSITARDTLTGHFVTTTITIVVAASPTTTTPTPAVTVTQSTSAGGGTTPPGPVNQTPVSSSPTVGISPTATPKLPTPTPTSGITPTATIGTTPTVGTTTTPHTTGTVTSSPLGSQSVLTSGPAMAGGPWLWIMIAGYAAAMFLLGCAGLLRKSEGR